MRDIDDDADAVHLLHNATSEVAQTRVAVLRAAVADHVPTVVRQVHHPHTHLEEHADVPEFVLDGHPVLRERHAVARHVEAVLTGGLRLDDVARRHGPREERRQHVGDVGVPCQAFHQAERILTLLASVLQDARDTRRLPRLLELLPLAGVRHAAGHAHVFGDVL